MHTVRLMWPKAAGEDLLEGQPDLDVDTIGTTGRAGSPDRFLLLILEHAGRCPECSLGGPNG